MGIFGLTTYISEHSSEFLKDHKLHDCCVLIDGNAAASIIYSHYTKSIHAFGGDYDKYAHYVMEFIQLLRKCNVQPCFIFDGGYEKRKLKTVIERIKLNVIICSQFKNKYKQSKCFPLLLRDVFKDVLRNNSVPVIQCDFEADQELIVLARIFKCPVISNDSDFYLSDVLYIPFSSLELKARKLNKKVKDKFCLKCKIYEVDVLLNKFGGLSNKSLLPLLSCALGNDYLPPNTFKKFLGISTSAKLSNRLEKLIAWLRGVIIFNVAVDQLSSCLEKKDRNYIKRMVKKLFSDYNRTCSSLQENIPESFFSYFKLSQAMNALKLNDSISEKALELKSGSELNDTVEPKRTTNSIYSTDDKNDAKIIKETVEFENLTLDTTDDVEILNEIVKPENITDNFDDKIDSKILTNTLELENLSNNTYNFEDEDGIEILDSYEYEVNYDVSSVEENENSIINMSNTINTSELNETVVCNSLPNWLTSKFRQAMLSPHVINIHNFRRIFIPSQSEDYNSDPSHTIIIPILEVVIAIVLGKNLPNEVKCHARTKKINTGVHILSPIFQTNLTEVPDLNTIELMDQNARRKILLKCLNMSENTNLAFFPEEWKIFWIGALYWLNNCVNMKPDQTHVRAVILCLIYLSIIDIKIGYIRQKSEFNHLRNIEKRNKNEAAEDHSDQSLINKFNELHKTEPLMLSHFLELIPKKHCLIAADALLHYHQFDNNLLNNRKSFDTKLVHCYAQLQHCIQSVCLLNSVFNFPYQHCFIYEAFSGTFLYNFYNDIHTRKLADDYITRTLLLKAEGIITLYRYLLNSLASITSTVKGKVEKKKKKTKTKVEIVELREKADTDEDYNDSENIYAMLSKSEIC